MSAIHYMRTVNWNRTISAPYLCGAMGGSASNKVSSVTCSDCLHILASAGGSGPRPLHKPPMMDERNTGIFEFYDVTYQHPMEVVPQSPSGNVEITLGDTLFTLHHLDRADLIRALLHDFHYSPERGGPTHDD